MIVFRYLSRELLITSGAVSAVLLVIIMSGRFIKYLAQAAQGALDPGVLLMIMGFRLPGFLGLILPLGLFLGILLAYGRLYLDSEMTVLSATGMSPQRLMILTLGPALVVALLVGWLSLVLAPRGLGEVARILEEQDALTEFDTLMPGRFQTLNDGSRVTYTRALSEDRTQLEGVFISETRPAREGGKGREVGVLVAERGRQVVQADGSRYLILENGYRYDGRPGHAAYRVIHYDTYGILLPRPEVRVELGELEALPTSQLIGSEERRHRVELQWRLSLPLLVLVVTLLAVPLARVNPRQGRYLKLLPAILLYMAYLSLLIAVRGALDKGRLPVALGFWWVHALFMAVGLLMLYWDALQLRLRRRRAGLEVKGG